VTKNKLDEALRAFDALNERIPDRELTDKERVETWLEAERNVKKLENALRHCEDIQDWIGGNGDEAPFGLLHRTIQAMQKCRENLREAYVSVHKIRNMALDNRWMEEAGRLSEIIESLGEAMRLVQGLHAEALRAYNEKTRTLLH